MSSRKAFAPAIQSSEVTIARLDIASSDRALRLSAAPGIGEGSGEIEERPNLARRPTRKPHALPRMRIEPRDVKSRRVPFGKRLTELISLIEGDYIVIARVRDRIGRPQRSECPIGVDVRDVALSVGE